ncbi:MAG: amidohydrolase [Planctomycetaceae bacterium]|nr:amidohydrolase [Planctomycetaceae bacterium]
MTEASSSSGFRDFGPAIDEFARRQSAAWIAYRRERHCSPEAGGEERETSHSVCERLKSSGIPAFIPPRGVGVVGDVLLNGATPETPAVAVRADIDALRMPDRKTVSYASIMPGLAHACGHDVHTTIVLGLAQTLCHLRQTSDTVLPCARIRLLFQPAEETCDGARWMIEDGYLNGVRSIIGVHVEPNLRVGQIGVRYGVFTAQVDEVFIHVRGRGGHTARPHATTDPVHAAAMLVCQLYQILPRSVDVRDASVLSFGQLEAGSASNVIPDEVRLAGTLRTIGTETRTELIRRIRECAAHMAAVTGNEITVDLRHPLGSVVNAVAETKAWHVAAADVVGDDGVVVLDRPSMGGEDFAMYMQCCSGSQIRLGCAASQPWPHLHSPVFDIDEDAIGIGIRVMTRTALMLATKVPAHDMNG